jgi:hypothetical protein
METLSFVNAENAFAAEAGTFAVFIGADSATKNRAEFTLAAQAK